jgi:hypothetical protein
VNVTVTRGAGGSSEVPIGVLNGFRVEANEMPHEGERPRWRLTALMLCTDLPEGSTVGHSCLHGPPPHLIRVVIVPKGMSHRGSRTKSRMDRLLVEIRLLAAARSDGWVVADV